MQWPWPYATAAVEPIRAQVKSAPEDFEVEELPLYPASGEGTHLFFTIEKRGLTTLDALRDVARQLGVSPRDIGYAGQKDARAVTRQRLSVEHVPAARIEALRHARLRVLSIERHANKLKLGHLAGNRFTLKLRDVPPDRRVDLERVLGLLVAKGVPNYFGPQRFGLRGDSWIVGRALLHADFEGALAQFAGRASDLDRGAVLRARQLFDRGDALAAAKAWPRGFRDALRAVGTFARTQDARRAVLAIDRNLLRFFVSSYQSRLFNDVVALRIDALDRVREGDLAQKHDNGAIFLVEDAAAENPRAEKFEISATGPLFGRRMTAPGPAIADEEASVLARSDETAAAFEAKGDWQPTGGRRALRFAISDLACDDGRDERGEFVRLSFRLPPGCYATSVLAEIHKSPPAE